MSEMFRALRREQFAGLLFVLLIHIFALWGLWSHRLLAAPQEAVTLFVNFIAPPMPPKVEPVPKREPPKPRREEPPQPRQLTVEAPALAATDAVAVPPAPTSAPAPAPVIAAPVGPVTLGAELSVSCPERTAPAYPPLSRRMNETGTTVLRVELDAQGGVSSARIATGSGHARLDEAALAAVKTWRCNPAQRNGQPVRAVALQPFKFVLQES